MPMRHFAVNGRKIGQIRESKGIEQAELAAKCGITQSYLSRIESGARNGSVPVIAALARNLGVGFDDITERLAEVAS